ncbi:MAG: hypothetical protein VW618_06945, partial [Alphaproteobacteria bacterium]
MDEINPVVPGDRLADAGGSPRQRAGEQHDQPAVLLQRDKALHLVCLIGGPALVRDGLADTRTLVL